MINNRISRLDSLRTLAVLLVVFYHLDIAGFGFGYLGVDLFFMLSGFLMTHTMLLNREKVGQFEVKKFYVRRFKRIVPSLLITILLTLVFSFVLLSPEQLADTAKQGLYSQFFLSNFLFFDQAGYFAPENEVRALLHTWSLSVEEQFYILFGIMLLIGKRINFTILSIIVAIIGLVFLLAAYWTLLFPNSNFGLFQANENLDYAIFYLPQFRLIQFLTGGLIALYLFKKTPKFTKKQWFQIIGILLPIAGTALLYFTPIAVTISSLIVVISFSLIFFSNKYLTVLGEFKPVKFIAKISYQLYLTHWPLIVFWKYWTQRELGNLDIIILFILSVITAIWLYQLSIFLVSEKIKVYKRAFALIAILLSAVALQTISYQGASWRLPNDRKFATPKELRALESEYCGNTNLLGGVELGSKASEPLVTCSRIIDEQKAVYVLGDSHARHLLAGLSEAFPNNTISVMYFTSCLAQSGILNFTYNYEGRRILAEACVQRNQRALEFFKNEPPSTIIIHQYSGYDGDDSREWLEASSYLIKELTSFGYKVVWVGSVLRPDILVTDCLAVPFIYSDKYLSKRCKGKQETIKKIFEKILD